MWRTAARVRAFSTKVAEQTQQQSWVSLWKNARQKIKLRAEGYTTAAFFWHSVMHSGFLTASFFATDSVCEFLKQQAPEKYQDRIQEVLNTQEMGLWQRFGMALVLSSILRLSTGWISTPLPFFLSAATARHFAPMESRLIQRFHSFRQRFA
ncbi:MAG: hypothetical protein MHM6MM_002364 [Cercozoa sp. M6MM]